MATLAQRALRNWPLKLAALTLSVLVWVLVTAQQTTSELVAVRLDLDVPASLAVASPLPEIRALVTGPGRELIKLYATPLQIHAAVPATAGPRWRLPINPADIIVSPAAAVSIQDVQPREIAVDVDRMVRRTVPVAVRGSVTADAGYVLDSLAAQPAEVTVTGAHIRVAELDSVPTEPFDARSLTGTFRRTVAIDTSDYPLLKFAPATVVVSAHAHKS